MLCKVDVFIKKSGQCVGGRGVIEGLGSQLKLDEHQRQPSAQTLYHYGASEGP